MNFENIHTLPPKATTGMINRHLERISRKTLTRTDFRGLFSDTLVIAHLYPPPANPDFVHLYNGVSPFNVRPRYNDTVVICFVCSVA